MNQSSQNLRTYKQSKKVELSEGESIKKAPADKKLTGFSKKESPGSFKPTKTAMNQTVKPSNATNVEDKNESAKNVLAKNVPTEEESAEKKPAEEESAKEKPAEEKPAKKSSSQSVESQANSSQPNNNQAIESSSVNEKISDTVLVEKETLTKFLAICLFLIVSVVNMYPVILRVCMLVFCMYLYIIYEPCSSDQVVHNSK